MEPYRPIPSGYDSPFGWLRGFSPGVSVLGNMGNFLGKLPDVLQNALILDIETSGIGKHHVIFEAALYDLKNNRTIEYKLAPARVLKEESRKVASYMTSMSELVGDTEQGIKGLAQPWSRERILRGKGQFAYLKDYFTAVEANPALLDELRSAGRVTIGKHTYLSPTAFFKNLSDDIAGTKGIYAANLQFENRQLASLFETVDPQLRKQIKQQFLSYSANSAKFLYRTADIAPYYGEAARTRSLSAWAQVGEAYRRGTHYKGGRAGDMLDIARASMAEGRIAGFLRTKDVATGTGVETLSQAFGLATKEIHSAAEDVKLESRLINKLVAANQRLSNLRKGGLRGFITAAEGLITGVTLRDIQAFQKIQAVQPTIKYQNLQRQLAHFELSLRGKDVEDFIIRDKVEHFRAPQVIGGKTVWQDVTWPTGPSVKSFGAAARTEAVPRFFNMARERLGLQGYGLDVAQEFQKVAAMPTSQLWKLYEPGVKLEAAEALSKRNLAIMQNAKTWSRANLFGHMMTNYKVPMFAAMGIGALMLARMWNGISSNDDDYNTIEGMPENGLAQQLRHAITDFGSGWRGIATSLSKFFNEWTGSPLFTHNPVTFYQMAKSPSRLGYTAPIPKILSEYAELAGGRQATHITQQLGRDFNRLSLLSKHNPSTVAVVRKHIFTEGHEEAANTMLHEFGHVLTLSPRGDLSRETSQSLRKFIGDKTHGNRIFNLRNSMLDPVAASYNRSRGKSFSHAGVMGITNMELAAESVSHALQKRLGVTASNVQYAGAYYPGAQLSPVDMLSTSAFGEELLQSQSVLHRLANISGKDDVYNTIKGLHHGGTAEALRKLFTDFGSGWVGSTLKAFKSVGNRIRGLFSSELKTMKFLDKDVGEAVYWGNKRTNKLFGISRSFLSQGASGFNANIGHWKQEFLTGIQTGTLKGRRQKEALSIISHMDKLSGLGFKNIPVVNKNLLSGGKPLATTAYHEYGHAITINNRGRLSSATTQIQRNVEASNPALKEVIATMKKAKELKSTESVYKELAADSFNIYRMKKKGLQPSVSGSYYWKTPKGAQVEAMHEYGRQIDLATSRIPSADDAYNTLEALRHGGMAQASRRGMDSKFGSGWTRDVTWSLPYEMSLTRVRAGAAYIEAARELTRNIMRSHYVPPGAWEAGISMNTYNSSLPFSSPDTRSKIRNRYETSGIGGHIAGFGDSGYSASYRSWNTGFGSGWKGLIATRDASIDFGGFREAVVQPDYSGATQYANLDDYPFPPVEVPLQTISPTRYMVDSISEELTQATVNRRVKDYFRKATMAEAQIATSMKMFMDSKTGAKRHAKGG